MSIILDETFFIEKALSTGSDMKTPIAFYFRSLQFKIGAKSETSQRSTLLSSKFHREFSTRRFSTGGFSTEESPASLSSSKEHSGGNIFRNLLQNWFEGGCCDITGIWLYGIESVAQGVNDIELVVWNSWERLDVYSPESFKLPLERLHCCQSNTSSNRTPLESNVTIRCTEVHQVN